MHIEASVIANLNSFAFICNNIIFSDFNMEMASDKSFFQTVNFNFTTTLLPNLRLNNVTLMKNMIFRSAQPLSQVTISNSYFNGIIQGDSSNMFNTGFVGSIIFTNHTFINVTSTDDKSVILGVTGINLIWKLNSVISNIQVSNSSTSLVDFGSFTNPSTNLVRILIENITFTNSYISTSMDFINTESIITTSTLMVTLNNLNFNGIRFAKFGNLLSLKHKLASPVVLSNSTFTNLTSSLLTIESPGELTTGLFTYVQISNCKFDQINDQYSSLLTINNKALVEVSFSNFTNIYTYEEAAILYAGFEKSSISFSYCLFLNNSAAEGTIFVIESESVVKCSNCTFTQNFGITGTIFKTSTNGYFQFENSTITENYAINNPVGELLDGANLCVINNSFISFNQVMSIDIIKSEFNSKCYLLCFVPQDFILYMNKNNLLVSSKFDIPLVQLILSSLTIDSSIVSNEGILFNIFLSTLMISNSQVLNVSNSIKTSSSNLTIINTQISNVLNNATNDFIFANLGSIVEMNNSILFNSFSSLLSSRNSQVKISHFNLTNVNSPSKLAQVTSCDSAIIANMKVINCSTTDLVFFDFDKTSSITLSNFSGSQTKSCFIQTKNSNVTKIDSFSVDKVLKPFIFISSSVGIISNSNFTNNGNESLRAGGVISMIDSKVVISKSQFLRNSAISGGAISFECTNLLNCNLTVYESSFYFNNGISKGGAIYYNYNRPALYDSVLLNNSAEYGPNFASYPFKIKMLENYSDKMMISNMVSGVQFDKVVKLSLVDFDEQIMSLYSINQITINSLNKTLVSINGVNSALLRNGIASFTNLIINAQPGSQNVQLQASSKAIDSIKIKKIYGIINNNFIYANFRFCRPGEIQQNDNTCSVCAPGTYSLNWNSTACSSCPSNANCLGGDQIYVYSGYWRRFYNSSTIVQCLNLDACVRGFIESNTTKGSPVNCKEGYAGNLCTDCVITNGQKYEKVSDYSCQKCPDPVLNTIRVSGLFLLVFAFIVCIIVVNVRKTEESQMSVLLRIFTNYLQLISSTMSFNVNYPSTLSSIFSPFSQIGSSSEVFLSFDCFITDYEIKGPFPSNKLFKIFLSALLPIILIAVFSVIWFMIRLMKNGWVPNIKRNIIISFITIIFLFHPRLTQQSLLIFQCTQIDTDVMMTKVDTQIVCYSEEHIKWMFALGFPILIVWVISAPIIALILLIKHHKSNDNSSIKEYFFDIVSRS